MTTPKVKPVKAWAGVIYGRINTWGNPPYVENFRTRQEARKRYETVIRVEIRPVEKVKK